MRTEEKINIREKEILKVMLRNNSWLNTSEISKESCISWNTTFKYLEILYDRGWLFKKGNYFKANR